VPRAYRSYRVGEEAEVEMRFTCRLGGGSYRASTTVATEDGRGVLSADSDAVHFYVPPRPFSWGLTDLQSSIVVDGIDVTAPDLPPSPQLNQPGIRQSPVA